MISNKKAERRLYPRIDDELPIHVSANGYDFATSTQNVSCVGAYCHIDKYVPPFTKVMIKLTLPVSLEGANKDLNVECKGVIVRSADGSSGGFNIAIFFNHIAEDQRKKISQYVNQFLPEKSSPFRS
jgi:hypothetical protein